jgi:hypothetical protein
MSNPVDLAVAQMKLERYKRDRLQVVPDVLNHAEAYTYQPLSINLIDPPHQSTKAAIPK